MMMTSRLRGLSYQWFQKMSTTKCCVKTGSTDVPESGFHVRLISVNDLVSGGTVPPRMLPGRTSVGDSVRVG